VAVAKEAAAREAGVTAGEAGTVGTARVAAARVAEVMEAAAKEVAKE